jgi:hypothetical protein
MATTSTTSQTSAGTRKKARKPARRKAAAARKTTTTRTVGAAKRGRARSARRSAATSSASVRSSLRERPVSVVGDYAERALLIPVGATLIARDRVVTGVSDTISTYSSTTKTQAQLRRFERRGATARKRLEREVRKTRTRVERELRQRRRRFEKGVNGLEARRDELAKNGSDIASRVPELANRVQERILSVV